MQDIFSRYERLCCHGNNIFIVKILNQYCIVNYFFSFWPVLTRLCDGAGVHVLFITFSDILVSIETAYCGRRLRSDVELLTNVGIYYDIKLLMHGCLLYILTFAFTVNIDYVLTWNRLSWSSFTFLRRDLPSKRHQVTYGCRPIRIHIFTVIIDYCYLTWNRLPWSLVIFWSVHQLRFALSVLCSNGI